MRSLIAIFILVFQVSSWGSQARVSALQSNHLLDTEYAYLFTTKLIELPDYVQIQSGAALNPDYTKRPYGAFKTSFQKEASDYYALGATFGRQSDLVDQARSRANNAITSNFEYTANAVDLNYTIRHQGNSYAVGFFYADKNDKLNQVGNHAGTMNLGIRIDDFSFSTNVGLFNYVDDQTSGAHLSINQSFMGALVYEMDDMQFLVDLSSSRAKRILGVTEVDNVELLNYKMSFVKNIFNGQETFFYRFNLETDQIKNRFVNINSRIIKLPLTLGLESSLSDEVKLRASLQQIVGVYQSDDFAAGVNTTTAAIGIGVNYQKISLDGTLQGLIGSTATQQVNANQVLTETSLTYWF